MVLSETEIKSRKIINRGYVDNYRPVSYDLCIKEIISMEGDVYSSYTLQPQSQVVIVSFETINIPKDIVGYAHIKTSYSRKGLLAINTGIIDPLYNGPISSVLLNFGKQPVKLSAHSKFMRLTFHETKNNNLDKRIEIPRDRYLVDRRTEALDNLDATFGGHKRIIKEAVDEAKKSVLQSLVVAGIGIAIFSSMIGLLIALLVNK